MDEQSERVLFPNEAAEICRKIFQPADYLLDMTEEKAIDIIKQEGVDLEHPYDLPEDASTQAKHAATILRLTRSARNALDSGNAELAVRQSMILGSVWERLRLTPMEKWTKKHPRKVEGQENMKSCMG